MSFIKSFVLFSFFLAQGALATGSNVAASFKDGDIIFQTSQSSQSKAIQLATRSKWSHVGIIFHISGKPYVYEAAGPVGYRALSTWIRSGESGKYMVRRTKSSLSAAQLTRMRNVAQGFARRPYDIYFGWDDSRIYCSELVWKIYSRGIGLSVGVQQKLGDFDLSHPEVRKILHERYGNNIPYHETVVSPEAIARSPVLTTVFAN
jgi:uncharacterized protein YycO